MILSKLEKPYSGSSLARIAVEVGEEEDIRLLMKYGYVDWDETAEGEDPAILWALINEKFGIVNVLMAVNEINLEGDPSAVLTIICDSETFKVHQYFLSAGSPVFSAMFNIDMKEAREGEITIEDMNADTLRSLIHYVYTGGLAEGWEDLEIQDMAGAADKYDLSGWMKLFCSALKEEVEVSGEKVAEMVIVGSRYQHSAARQLRVLARDKIRERREITEDLGFREKLSGEIDGFVVLFEFLAIL